MVFDAKKEVISLTNFKKKYGGGGENPDCGPMTIVVNADPIKDFRKDTKALKAINERTVYIGMSEEVLLVAMGPMKVNKTNFKGHITKQYVMGDRTYIYVENGKVTATQNY